MSTKTYKITKVKVEIYKSTTKKPLKMKTNKISNILEAKDMNKYSITLKKQLYIGVIVASYFAVRIAVSLM